MRKISLLILNILYPLPTLEIAGSYNANGGYCNMIAIRDSFDVYHRYKLKKGEIGMMVGMDVGKNTVSLFRCCDYNVRDFKHVDNCRLPKSLEYVDKHGFSHTKFLK